MVARLREAGVVVLGKANMSEWANMRSPHSTSGWSARGGLTRNPWDPTRSAGGSSSGSAAALSAGVAPSQSAPRLTARLSAPPATTAS